MPPNAAPDPPAAAQRRPDEHRLVGCGGTALHYWFWPAAASGPDPAGSSPKLRGQRTVLIVHGAGEYAERYRTFAAFLNSNGYHAAALDLRGFGCSGGPRAFVRRFRDFVNDIAVVADQVLRMSGADALDLLGHSMGALAAATAVASGRPTRTRSLILSSPCFALKFPVPAHLRAIGAVCSLLKPTQLFATRAISELLTHDPALAREHREDPRIVHFMSARLFFEMHRAMRAFPDAARRIDVPTAVFQAGDDRVVDTRASQAFYERLPHPGKRWKLYPGFFHEILNETGRTAVYEDVLAFLNQV